MLHKTPTYIFVPLRRLKISVHAENDCLALGLILLRVWTIQEDSQTGGGQCHAGPHQEHHTGRGGGDEDRRLGRGG